jgi:hypothetical protein
LAAIAAASACGVSINGLGIGSLPAELIHNNTKRSHHRTLMGTLKSTSKGTR